VQSAHLQDEAITLLSSLFKFKAVQGNEAAVRESVPGLATAVTALLDPAVVADGSCLDQCCLPS
jgi:hypothetical protein